MEAGGDLAGGVQPGHRRCLGLGVDADPAHHVVARRPDLHRLLGDVDVGQFAELVVHAGQAPRDVFGVAAAGDVEVHPAVGTSPTLLDLGVDRPRDLVAGEQVRRAADGLVVVPAVGLLLGVGGLGAEHLRDVAEHEPLALGVAQHPSVAADPLGHEDAAHRRRPHHARRVELDELHVDEIGAGPQGEGVAVARVLPRVRRDLVGLADAARREDHGGRLEHHEAARLPPVGERAGDAVAVLEQPGDRALHEDRDLRLRWRGAGASGSSPARCGRRRGPGGRTGGPRSRAGGCARPACGRRAHPTPRARAPAREPPGRGSGPSASWRAACRRAWCRGSAPASCRRGRRCRARRRSRPRPSPCAPCRASDLHTIAVRAPWRAASIAARRPAPPAPTTTTSKEWDSNSPIRRTADRRSCRWRRGGRTGR